MGKKKENLRNLFRESIDPHFSGVFTSNDNNNSNEKCSDDLQAVNVEGGGGHSKNNRNVGFQNFISTKLAEYLDKHIKEVNRPVDKDEFFTNKLGSICLFSDSDPISEEQPTELVQQKHPKKKRRKEKSDKESLKEVAVTYEWIQKQAQLLKS